MSTGKTVRTSTTTMATWHSVYIDHACIDLSSKGVGGEGRVGRGRGGRGGRVGRGREGGEGGGEGGRGEGRGVTSPYALFETGYFMLMRKRGGMHYCSFLYMTLAPTIIISPL